MLQLSSSIHWFSSGTGNKKMRNYLNHRKRNSEGTKSTQTKLEVSLQASLAFSTVSDWGENGC